MPDAPPSAWGSAPAAPPATWSSGPQPGGQASDADARMWAMLAHLSGIIFLVLGPLVIWLIKKDESPFVAEHGREALNFNITILIAFIACGILSVAVIGVFLFPLVGIALVVLAIMAGLKANAGEYYRYPATLRLIK
jgi:uncharacterized protein